MCRLGSQFFSGSNVCQNNSGRVRSYQYRSISRSMEYTGRLGGLRESIHFAAFEICGPNPTM